jgi:hypothetical protein
MSSVERETLELFRVLRIWLGENTFRLILMKYYGVNLTSEALVKKLDDLVSMVREKHGDYNLVKINYEVINDIFNVLRQRK